MLIIYRKKQSTTMGTNLWDKEKTKEPRKTAAILDIIFHQNRLICLEQINLL